MLAQEATTLFPDGFMNRRLWGDARRLPGSQPVAAAAAVWEYGTAPGQCMLAPDAQLARVPQAKAASPPGLGAASPGTAWSAAPPPGTVCKGSCGCAHCGGLQLHTVAACASGWETAGAPGEAWVGVERNPISRITSPATPREIAGLGTEPGFPGHKSLNPWGQAQRERLLRFSSRTKNNQETSF